MAKTTPSGVAVTIFRGTYYVGPGEEYGPGKTVTVDAEEAARLKAAGFLKPDDYVEPAEVQDGTLKITAEDGAQVTVGQLK